MKFITKHLLSITVLITTILTITAFAVRPTTAHATGSCVTDSFCTTWQTTADGESIVIPTYPGFGYSYDVDWGDGNTDTARTGDVTHFYTTAGTYTVSITGTFPAIYFNNGGDKEKILSIEQWGTIQWATMDHAFQGCVNLQGNAVDAPDFSQVVFMNEMFSGATSFNQDISSWDVSSVTDMSGMFDHATSFNQDISSWDVSNVTSMSLMFGTASSFNQPLNAWGLKTSNVTNMSGMFGSETTSVFNQSIDTWDVSNVVAMDGMFANAQAFNQPLNAWGSKTSNVTDMSNMFNYATAFNQPLNSWDVSSVTNMNSMFANTSFNQPLDLWNVASVTDMGKMFEGNAYFNQNINAWNVSSVTNMNGVFHDAFSFNQPLNLWDVSNVVDMYGMFANAQSFNQPLNAWGSKTSNVTSMRNLFTNAFAFDQDLSDWDVSQATDFNAMFANSNYNHPLNSWDMSSATTISYMFGANSSFNQSLDQWDVSHVTDMTGMFIAATSFDQDLSSWDVSQVTSMSSIYGGFLTGATLSVANYDALLAAWSQQSLQSGVVFDAGNSKYCTSETWKSGIVSNYNWTIIDGGKECPVTVTTTVSSGQGAPWKGSSPVAAVAPTQPLSLPLPITRTLKHKSTGPDVRLIQSYLNTHGYSITAVGKETTYFGIKTKAAVMRFQKDHRLVPDGVVGPATKALMI